MSRKKNQVGGKESQKQAKSSVTSPTPSVRSTTRTSSYTNIYANGLHQIHAGSLIFSSFSGKSCETRFVEAMGFFVVSSSLGSPTIVDSSKFPLRFQPWPRNTHQFQSCLSQHTVSACRELYLYISCCANKFADACSNTLASTTYKFQLRTNGSLGHYVHTNSYF